MKLTKRVIDALEIKDKKYVAWDDEVSKFGCVVYPTGKKTFMIQYRDKDGRTRKYTLGPFGTLTVDQARNMAREKLVDVLKGGNPALDKRAEALAPTVEEFCDTFMDDYARKKVKDSTLKEYQRCVDKFIKPELGKRKLKDITKADILKLHEKHGGIPYQANRTRGVLSKMFNYAEDLELRPDNSNPVLKVKPYPEKKRDRYLSPEELKALGKALKSCEETGTESPYMIAAIKLLILTGCRLGEIQTLKWDYIRGNAFFLPDSKTGAKKVYVGQPALEVLAGIERLEGNPYVICGAKEGQYLTDFQKPWRRIRKKAGLDKVRIHDLRHTYASVAVNSKESLQMTGKLLGHSNTATTERYAHLADDPAHQAADRVSGLIGEAMG
ncbi:integrase [Kordiimonas sediminis]|uniref:Integrase n=1 Tax=Kordiimonas sediminis TaxID=1735581 RepID=A0A919AY60_9PROT|nr:site-specific integrase [Kordiimonas sediminis]GHF31400.1 integrase [Kordiimonas sediminis]